MQLCLALSRMVFKRMAFDLAVAHHEIFGQQRRETLQNLLAVSQIPREVRDEGHQDQCACRWGRTSWGPRPAFRCWCAETDSTGRRQIAPPRPAFIWQSHWNSAFVLFIMRSLFQITSGSPLCQPRFGGSEQCAKWTTITVCNQMIGQFTFIYALTT